MKSDKIIQLLMVKNPLTAKEISEKLDMNIKTVYYYLKMLKDKNLIFSSDGKYYLTKKGKRYAVKLVLKSISDYLVIATLSTFGISIGLFYNIVIYVVNAMIILYIVIRLLQKLKII